MSFRRGETVVCPRYGVGRVVKSEERPVFGRTQRCLEIRFASDNRTVFLHEEDFTKVHLRNVMGSNVLRHVYKTLREPDQYTRTRPAGRRMERYRAKAVIGDPMSLAEVVRDLGRRSQSHRLNEDEQQIADSAVDLLKQEIAVVENREEEAILTKINRILSR